MWEKRMQLLFGLFVLVLIAFLFSGLLTLPVTSSPDETSPAQTEAADMANTNLIVLDAGHGGVDPGKIGVNDAKEKDVNLQIVYYLMDFLQDNGVEVVLTREDDEGLYSEYASNKKTEDMQKRCAIIEEANPAFTVSIHQNSYHDGSVKGAQVFYYEKSDVGKQLAETIQSALIEQLDPSNGRQAKANSNYYMLRRTVSPTVLIECGFLSNWEEAQLLVTEEYQKKVAEAIGQGILTFMDMDKQG